MNHCSINDVFLTINFHFLGSACFHYVTDYFRHCITIYTVLDIDSVDSFRQYTYLQHSKIHTMQYFEKKNLLMTTLTILTYNVHLMLYIVPKIMWICPVVDYDLINY